MRRITVCCVSIKERDIKTKMEKITQKDILLTNKNLDLKDMIFIIRDQPVMLDSDLAILYQVETKRLLEQTKRNIKRFPASFCFKLTKEEYENLRSQFEVSSSEEYGGRRYLPYVYTEQGIAMLSAVLHSETAIEVSIQVIDAFVQMRRFLSNNSILFERIQKVELQQLEYHKETNEKFDRIFNYISNHEETTQRIFFNGQIYDAFSLLVSLVQKATQHLILIAGYTDISTLNLMAKKNSGVSVLFITYPTLKDSKNAQITATDIAKFNNQYPLLTIKYSKSFHDRFLIIDHQEVYHIGASIKDAGKKTFAISLLDEQQLVSDLFITDQTDINLD